VRRDEAPEGRHCGRVRDLRIQRDRTPGADGSEEFHVVGIVVGGGRLVHAWGLAEGRATGPWLLRVATAAACQAGFVPVDQVRARGPGGVSIRGNGDDLPGSSTSWADDPHGGTDRRLTLLSLGVAVVVYLVRRQRP